MYYFKNIFRYFIAQDAEEVKRVVFFCKVITFSYIIYIKILWSKCTMYQREQPTEINEHLVGKKRVKKGLQRQIIPDHIQIILH